MCFLSVNVPYLEQWVHSLQRQQEKNALVNWFSKL